MMAEIHLTYEEILQLEQALIELDEQNTTNTLEIRKREAKIIVLKQQIKENETETKTENKENVEVFKKNMKQLEKQIGQHRHNIGILEESTRVNLQKRNSMKQNLYEYYQQISKIRDSIGTDRIQMQDNKDFLELMVKNNFLESQNVQLLLNIQLQARTIMELKKNMGKMQKFIEEHKLVPAAYSNESNLNQISKSGE